MEKNGAWAYTGTAQIYAVLPIISGTLKAMNFKFGWNIRRLNPSKRPLKILETRGRGRSQGLSKIFRAATYRAHRTVVFAIAQLSCFFLGKECASHCVNFQSAHMDHGWCDCVSDLLLVDFIAKTQLCSINV